MFKIALCAKIYEHMAGQHYGWTISAPDGAEVSWIGSQYNDGASGATVRPGCTLELFQHGNYLGTKKTLKAGLKEENFFFGPPIDFHDQASSYKCNCEAYWSDWTSWSVCDSPCNGGSRSRSRDCVGASDGCDGSNLEVEECNTCSCGTNHIFIVVISQHIYSRRF